MNILNHIRTVPDFPKPGIEFYDIATLLGHPQAWAYTIDSMAKSISAFRPDMLIGIDARGFLIASPLAIQMNLPLGMIRKKGKLPGEVLRHEYVLEYGSDSIEIQPNLIPDGARIVLVDDLLATGGTLAAAETLVDKAGAKIVAHAVIIELGFLGGREKLSKPVHTEIFVD